MVAIVEFSQSMKSLTLIELQDFIAANEVRLHEMSLPQFRHWLECRIEEASRRDMFRQRQLIRDIKREHARRLRQRGQRLDEARQAYEGSTTAKEYEQLLSEAEGLSKAVSGLQQAVNAGRAEPAKLQEYEQRLELLQQQISESEFSEKRALDRAQASFDKLRDEIGLTQAEQKLDEIGTQRGKSSTGAGSRFEAISSEATYKLIVPSLDFPKDEVAVLHGATLGCARGEIDQIVVFNLDADVVRVEAVIEAKRNINDLAHGFRLRQENLAWFVGDSSGFNAEQYRTDRFPNGVFEGTVCHNEQAREFCFDRSSFSLFESTDQNGYRTDRLYFVTEQRPLLGTTTAELGRILHRAATDPKFKIESDSNLKKFREWALEFVAEFQSLDVLELYAGAGLPGNIIMITERA